MLSCFFLLGTLLGVIGGYDTVGLLFHVILLGMYIQCLVSLVDCGVVRFSCES